MPKVHGGPFFKTLKKVKSYWRDNGFHYCRIDMPCTFEPDDGLLFSVESDKMETKKAANQHACFRAVAHMLAADQRQVRLVDCHWHISLNDLKELITDVLHQFPVAASSSFDQYPAANDLPICGVTGCNFRASKPHPEVATCFICDRHLLQMAQHNSPATEPQPSVAAAASSDTMLPKPLAVEPPSEQCLSAAALKALCGDNRQLRKHKQMTTATATALGDGMLAAVVPEQCSSASGIAVAAKKARPNRSSQKPQSKTAALTPLAPIAETTIQDEDTSSALDGLLQEPRKELAYLERMD
jgi:hypothetical protein